MARNHYWLSDTEWRRIKPLLPHFNRWSRQGFFEALRAIPGSSDRIGGC